VSTVMTFPFKEMMESTKNVFHDSCWTIWVNSGFRNLCNRPVCRQDVGKSAPSQKSCSIRPNNELLLSKLFYNSIHKSSYTYFMPWSICEFISII
jgi:hypothetical protein